MDVQIRSRVIHWLLLLGPLGSLGSLALGLWFLQATAPGEALETFLSNLTTVTIEGVQFAPATIYPDLMNVGLGWALLTLGCSAGTCLRALRNQGKRGGVLALYMLLATPVLAVAQMAISVGVVVTGCEALWGPWRT